MAETVIGRGAEYVLPIKGNQDSLLSDARAEIAKTGDPPAVMTKSEEHGRIETRRAIVVAGSDLAAHHEFPGLKAIGMIEATPERSTARRRRSFAISRCRACSNRPSCGASCATIGESKPPALGSRRGTTYAPPWLAPIHGRS
jgi:hypothetical protein